MKTKLLMALLSASLLLFSGSAVFAATQPLAAPSALLGEPTNVDIEAPFSKNVTGRYTGDNNGIGYEAGVYHSGGTREWGTGSGYTSIYRIDCAGSSCGSITTTAGGTGETGGIDFSTAEEWTAQ